LEFGDQCVDASEPHRSFGVRNCRWGLQQQLRLRSDLLEPGGGDLGAGPWHQPNYQENGEGNDGEGAFVEAWCWD
jgi:hypothetical protein